MSIINVTPNQSLVLSSTFQYATAIKIEALAQLGRMLRETERNRGAAGIGPIVVPKENHNEPPTLADLGLDKKTSKLAKQRGAGETTPRRPSVLRRL